MTGYNKLQTEIATGRLTLPVVILICLFLWGVSIHSWNELISFISCALTGYMMIEINTAFTLIRTRTMLHVSLFGFIISACMFLHPFHISNLVPPAFIIALFQLFRSYESGQASGNIFHSFFSFVLYQYDQFSFFVGKNILCRTGWADSSLLVSLRLCLL